MSRRLSSQGFKRDLDLEIYTMDELYDLDSHHAIDFRLEDMNIKL